MVRGRRSRWVVDVRLARRRLFRAVLMIGGVVVGCLPALSEEPATELDVNVLPDTVPKVEIEYAELLLRRTAAAYERLHTYQDETLVTISTAGRFGRTVEARYHFAFERPNKVAIERLPGMRILCDGEKLYTHLSAINKYAAEKAPMTIEGILEASPFGLGWQGLSPLKTLSLFGDSPYETMMESVDELEFVGDEYIDGAKAHHIVLRRGGADIDLWTDVETDLIRKISSESSQHAAMPGATPVRIIFEEFHNRISANTEIPQGTFVFKRPEGAQYTDDIFAELHGGTAQTSPLIGKTAPDFTLEQAGETRPIRLSDYKGKVVLLVFFTTQCPACDLEMPLLQEMYGKYKKRGATFIAVNARESRRAVEQYVAKRKYAFPVALDADGRTTALYKLDGFPTVVLIDKSGMVRKVYPGYARGFERAFKRELDKLLAE